MDDVLWGGVDVLSTGQDITSLRKMVLVSVMRRHFQAGDSIVGLDSLATLLAKLPSHDLSTVADIAKGKTGIKDAKPGPYPLVVTAEARSECDHFDYEGPAVLIPMVSSTGHGDASLKRIHYQEGQYAVGTILAVVRPLNPAQLSARYLYEYLSAFKDELLVSRMVGTANVSLTVKKLGDVPVPLIPFESQRQIERLMALCDRLEADQADAEAAQAQLVQALLDSLTQATDAADFRVSWQRLSEHFHTLFTTEASIDALKQMVWRLAVAGKLVHQDASDGSAQYILDQVQAIQAASKNKRRNKTATSSRSGAAPFELPAQWVWCELQDAFDVRDGTHDTPSYQSHGVPLVTSKNLSSGRLDMTNVKLISMVDHLQISERSKVDVGDVLFAMIGSIGNPVLVETEQPFSIKNVALFKHYDSTLTVPRYLLLYLLVASDEMRAQSAGGVQSFISLGNLRSFPLPLPPAQEQRRIVAKVDELMALCDQLKGYLAESRQQHAQLATVLVEQAVA